MANISTFMSPMWITLALAAIMLALALIPLGIIGYNHLKRVATATAALAVLLLLYRRNILLNQKVKQNAQDRKDILRADKIRSNSDRDSDPDSLRRDDGFKRD